MLPPPGDAISLGHGGHEAFSSSSSSSSSSSTVWSSSYASTGPSLFANLGEAQTFEDQRTAWVAKQEEKGVGNNGIQRTDAGIENGDVGSEGASPDGSHELIPGEASTSAAAAIAASSVNSAENNDARNGSRRESATSRNSSNSASNSSHSSLNGSYSSSCYSSSASNSSSSYSSSGSSSRSAASASVLTGAAANDSLTSYGRSEAASRRALDISAALAKKAKGSDAKSKSSKGGSGGSQAGSQAGNSAATGANSNKGTNKSNHQSKGGSSKASQGGSKSDASTNKPPPKPKRLKVGGQVLARLPRSPHEELAFQRGLQQGDLWFAHSKILKLMCTPAPLPTPPKLVPPPPNPEDEHINVLQFYSQESQDFLVREGLEEANPDDLDGPLMRKKSPKSKQQKKKKKGKDGEKNDDESEAGNQSGTNEESKTATALESEGKSTKGEEKKELPTPSPPSRGPLPPRPSYFHSGWPVAEVTLSSFACLGGGERGSGFALLSSSFLSFNHSLTFSSLTISCQRL